MQSASLNTFHTLSSLILWTSKIPLLFICNDSAKDVGNIRFLSMFSQMVKCSRSFHPDSISWNIWASSIKWKRMMKRIHVWSLELTFKKHLKMLTQTPAAPQLNTCELLSYWVLLGDTKSCGHSLSHQCL